MRSGGPADWSRGRLWARTRIYLLPAVLLLAIALPHLDQGDWRTDTGRYAAVGLQAWRESEFLTLRTHPDDPWFNKPPLAILIHGLFVHVGGVHLWVARLPSVLAAVGCVLAAVWTARAFHVRGVALVVGLVLAMTYEFFRRSREVSLDLWQLFFLTTAMGMYVRAVSGSTVRWASGSGAMIGLALLCKPLVGLMALPILGAWSVAVTEHRGRAALSFGLLTLAAVAVAAPWHVYMVVEHGAAFTGQYFGAEVADRAAGEIRTQPLWYYLSLLAKTYWPWMIPLFVGLVSLVRHLARGRDGLALASIWLVVWLSLISLFPDKAPRYAIILYPSAAWIAGWWVATNGATSGRRTARRVTGGAIGVACVVSVVIGVLPIRVQRGENPAWTAALETTVGREVVAIDVDTNQIARFYLAGQAWPTPIEIPSDAPPTVLILRTPDFDWVPPPNEKVVFREERVCLTRRRSGAESPSVP
ncbi:MAG: hypothetical protein CMJ31_00775 [Phycisphaerae bacterium]|nr:hypothetical protein [Phycisphaerae bacterium]